MMSSSVPATRASNAETRVTDGFEVVIGLEVHCQLRTRTKLFSAASASFGDAPNANTDAVCLGLPGALPVLNREAIRLATRASLGLECTVHEVSVFARKHYFYPDLPKGYQISQFDRPLATGGRVVIGTNADGSEKAIGITRVHVEEDAGKSIHDRFVGYSAIDLNRAGTPLIEIVSEPDLRSAADAGAYLRELKQILEYTDVSDANMEEGSLRVDVNISTRPIGESALGTRTEIKNLNSFSGVERSIELEFARQCAVLRGGGVIEQRTMLWDGHKGEVRPARAKEGSHDYRYFPEPDLPPLVLDAAWIEEQRRTLAELPAARRRRFAAQYGLGRHDVEQLTASVALADRFEAVAAASGDAKRAANWVLGVVLASVKVQGGDITSHPVSPERLGALIRLELEGAVSNTAAKQIFAMLEAGDADPRLLAEREGLLQVRDESALVAWIDEVLAEMPEEAGRFLGGEKRLQGVLVGAVMKKSKGSADPKRVNQLLSQRADAQ
jgi:aspartyl-tRNA(Asn)/glutamyl-tRNA(Gln) amidotransferase subunit B